MGNNQLCNQDLRNETHNAGVKIQETRKHQLKEEETVNLILTSTVQTHTVNHRINFLNNSDLGLYLGNCYVYTVFMKLC